MASRGRSRLKDRSLEWWHASSTLEQLFQVKAQNGRFSLGLHKPVQLWQSRSQYGEITTYLLNQRWNWCALLSYPYLCTLVSHGPWQQNLKKRHRPLRWDATIGYWTSHTRTISLVRIFAERSKQPLEIVKLLTLVKWFGHMSRSSGLAKTVLQGTVKGKRRKGR